VGPLEPLALVPDTSRAPLMPALVVYDVDRQAEILTESEAFFQAWLAAMPPFTYADGERVRLFDQQSREWLRLDLGDHVQQLVSSEDGSKVALTVDGRTYLVDLAGKRIQQEISTLGRPELFSPNGERLVLRMPEQEGVGPYVVLPLDDPAAASRLPLVGEQNENSQHSPQWLDNDRLMLVSQNSYLLQVYDVSGAMPQIVLEEAVESDQVVLSPDGSRIAVGEHNPGGTGSVVVYEMEPFGQIARFDNATLGQHLAVPRAVWSSDGSKLLTPADECLETESLVSRQIDGPEASVELASEVHLYRFVFSPNGEWVAFTTHARNAYVAPADGSSPPVLIGDDVNAVAVPQWAPDSTWVAFYRFFGGYDRCLGVLPPSP
jgi:hypothetical protein